MKLLENALTALLCAERALIHYEPTEKDRKPEMCDDDIASYDELKGELKGRTGMSDLLLAITIHRLLAILKQLASFAISKKRCVCVCVCVCV